MTPFRVRLAVVIAPLVVVVAVVEPLALLLAAPWLVAVVWVTLRTAPGADDLRAFPSAAEEARRRLAR